MKTDREEMMELVNEAHEYCDTINCIGGEECGYDGQLYCFEHLLIDYLISKGGTIPVRCGDCEKEQDCKIAQYLGQNGFCSYGERKEE